MRSEAATMLARSIDAMLRRLLTSDEPPEQKRQFIHELRVQLEDLERTFDGHEGEQ